MGVTARAIEVIEEAIDGGDVELARDWIRMVDINRIADTQLGPTNPDEIIEQRNARPLGEVGQGRISTCGSPSCPWPNSLVRRTVIDEMERPPAADRTHRPSTPPRHRCAFEVFCATAEVARCRSAATVRERPASARSRRRRSNWTRMTSGTYSSSCPAECGRATTTPTPTAWSAPTRASWCRSKVASPPN